MLPGAAPREAGCLEGWCGLGEECTKILVGVGGKGYWGPFEVRLHLVIIIWNSPKLIVE